MSFSEVFNFAVETQCIIFISGGLYSGKSVKEKKKQYMIKTICHVVSDLFIFKHGVCTCVIKKHIQRTLILMISTNSYDTYNFLLIRKKCINYKGWTGFPSLYLLIRQILNHSETPLLLSNGFKNNKYVNFRMDGLSVESQTLKIIYPVSICNTTTVTLRTILLQVNVTRNVVKIEQ